MASSVLIGQTALCALPPAPAHGNEEETISTYNLPVQLKISSNVAKKRGTGSGVLGNGMDVYKVSKVGKRQQRRVAISLDNRKLLVSSNNSFMGLLRRKRSGIQSVNGNDIFRQIEIRSIDRIVRGQVTEKFVRQKPKELAATMKMPVSEDKLSLSIIFRISSAATDRMVQEEDLEVSTDSSNQMATLDLVIPSHNDFELFVSTIRNLMILNRKYFSSMHRDILLLQHHWLDIGKPYDVKINQSDWTRICCDRLSTDLGRNAVLTLYRKYCSVAKTRPEEGISLSKAVGLLEHTRQFSLLLKSIADPCDRVWDLIETNGKGVKPLGKNHCLPDNNERRILDFGDDHSIGGDSTTAVLKAKPRNINSSKAMEEYVSAKAFLKFIVDKQKESNMTLSQVRILFERLNAQTYASQLSKDGVTNVGTGGIFSKDYITKTVFFNYLLSDVNDAFDPLRGRKENDDMTQPLSSYWINASHDTYLKNVSPRMKQRINRDNAFVDVSMYTTALNRGTRCLKVDVWDGMGLQKGQPVVRFDEHKSVGVGNINKDGVLFSDIVKALHSFLVSEPSSLPIILFVEAHCTVAIQEKMAESILLILGSDDMIFVPSEHDFDCKRTLPSPDDLRGKVVLKFKTLDGGRTRVVYDDFDDLNDFDPFDINTNQSNDGANNFADVGSVLFESSRDLEKDPDTIVKNATIENAKAKKAAEAADDKAFNTNVKVNRASDVANKLLSKAGLSPEQVERNLALRSGKLLPQVEKVGVEGGITDREIDRDEASHKTGSTGAGGTIADETFADGTITDGTIADATVDGSTYTKQTTATRKPFGGFMQRLLGWADTLDGSESLGGSYLDEDREVAESMDDSFNSSYADSRDEIDFNDDVSLDFDVDVKTFLQAPGNVVDDLKQRQAERVRQKAELEEEKRRQREIQLQHGSISNVEKKLQSINEDSIVEGGVEMEHFYSGTVDYALYEQKEAEAEEEKASKILAAATAKFNKQQQLYEAAKKDIELVEKFQYLHSRYEEAIEKKTQAVTTSSTARTEFQISEERAVETAETAEKAREQREVAHAAEKELSEKASIADKELKPYQDAVDDAVKAYEVARKKNSLVKHEHEKVTENIKTIESSHKYKVEKRAASRGVPSEGTTIRKHRIEVEKQLMLNSKFQVVKAEKAEANRKKAEAEEALTAAKSRVQDVLDEAQKAREYADQCDAYADQVEQLADEERDAANMRKQASEKAEQMLQEYDARIHKLTKDVKQAKLAIPERLDLSDVPAIALKRDKAQKKLDAAEVIFNEAQEAYKWVDARLKDANKTLTENSDVLMKAKADAAQLQHRVNAEEILKESAINAYERLEKLKAEAEESKEQASRLQIVAAQKATALRHAKDYKQRRSLVLDISSALMKLTLLGSSKFRYFEESFMHPANNVHSISEGKMIQMFSEDSDGNLSQFKEFNKSHITRVFPSRQKTLRMQSSNFNPVFPWSLGCQVVSMNQQVCDAFILVNDARFRVNGSCGYVLKPESMIQRNSMKNQSTVRPTPMNWKFRVLSGNNLPKTRKKAVAGALNPRVRITMYDGGAADPVVHLTPTVQRNGLNPVWNEESGAIFENIKHPESTIILFSVWDFNESGVEDFIAAAGIPLSCMREGYRSVQLFDSNHMRCGAHAFSSLFVHAEAY